LANIFIYRKQELMHQSKKRGITMILRKKANVLITVLIVAGLLASMTFLILSTKDEAIEGPEGLSDLMMTYDDTITLLGEAIEGSVAIALSEYSMNGYSDNTPLWLEDLPIPPDETEREDSLRSFLEGSIDERLAEMLEGLGFDSGSYLFDTGGMVIDLVPETYTDSMGIPHDGYRIEVRNVVLESIDPPATDSFDYSYEFPMIWAIYDYMLEYMGDETEGLLSALNAFTAGTQCSDVMCSCSGPGGGIGLFPDEELDYDAVKALIDGYYDGFVTFMGDRDITCGYEHKAFDVLNNYTMTFETAPEDWTCTSTSGPAGSSPDRLYVYSPEGISDPGKPLPYQTPSSTYYDYSPKPNHPRDSGVADLGTWPVDLTRNSNIPASDSSEGVSGPTISVTMLWRAITALTYFYCEDPDQMVIGADPDNPSVVGHMRVSPLMRINTIAPCPPPVEADMPELQQLTTECGECKKAVCSETDPDGECVPDNIATPTASHPCDVMVTGDIDCSVSGANPYLCEGCGLMDCGDCEGCVKSGGKCVQEGKCWITKPKEWWVNYENGGAAECDAGEFCIDGEAGCECGITTSHTPEPDPPPPDPVPPPPPPPDVE
jgi:hypothetical protein